MEKREGERSIEGGRKKEKKGDRVGVHLSKEWSDSVARLTMPLQWPVPLPLPGGMQRGPASLTPSYTDSGRSNSEQNMYTYKGTYM